MRVSALKLVQSVRLLFDQDRIVGRWRSPSEPRLILSSSVSDSGHHRSESQKAAFRSPLTDLAASAWMLVSS